MEAEEGQVILEGFRVKLLVGDHNRDFPVLPKNVWINVHT